MNRTVRTLGLLFGLALVWPAAASLPQATGATALDSTMSSVRLKAHNPRANQILNKALGDAFWGDAWARTYDDRLYDIVRLKSLPDGYVPMIAGESDEDIPHEVVADIVYEQNTRIPKYMSGAKAIIDLGNGYDEIVGAPYRDSYYVLDLTLFYGTYTQRMYRLYDEENRRTILWFEKLEPSFTDADTWSRYEDKMSKLNGSLDTRWAFNSFVPFGEVFGMFVVTPGSEHESRVTFVSKLAFGDDAGWVAKWGSQLPGVIKSGLKAGYNACVTLAKVEKRRRLASPSPKVAPQTSPNVPPIDAEAMTDGAEEAVPAPATSGAE